MEERTDLEWEKEENLEWKSSLQEIFEDKEVLKRIRQTETMWELLKLNEEKKKKPVRKWRLLKEKRKQEKKMHGEEVGG